MSLLEVTDLGVDFSTRHGIVRAVDDVTLTADESETVVLLGPSGCGKTTVLRAIGGLEAPTRGRITVAGKPVVAPGPDRVVMFQEHSLFPWLTVAGNIDFGMRSSGLDRAQRRERVDEWIERVQLGGSAKLYPAELSGGMRQRVSLARSLASGAPMILMDEPFAALDAQTRTDMQEQLLAIVRAERRCVIFVTHDVDEGILLGDRLVVMGTRPGHIIEDFQNPLGTQRGSDMFASPAYGTFKQQVTELIRGRHHTTIEIGSTND